MAVYAIGDIQGCFDELQVLLELIHFSPQQDHLWFAGDLVLHAQHLEQAGDDKAPRAYLEAAREQARQYRSEIALDLIECGLNLQPQQSDRHPLTCFKADLLLDMGEVESSLAVYQLAERNALGDQQLCDIRLRGTGRLL